MPNFSEIDLKKLETCHKDLQMVFKLAVNIFPIKILWAERGEFEQNKAFELGNSKVRYPDSKHNLKPPEREKSHAVDASPDPIPYEWGTIPKDFNILTYAELSKLIKARAKFYYFAGIIKACAFFLKLIGFIEHSVIWGGDWDSDNDFANNGFDDLLHFELRK